LRNRKLYLASIESVTLVVMRRMMIARVTVLGLVFLSSQFLAPGIPQ
jgi:hypothetical protein